MKPQSLVLRIYFVAILALAFFTETTSADLSVERWVRDNSLSATTLSFTNNSTVNNTKTSTLFRTQGLVASGFDVGSVRLVKDGQMKFKYRLTSSLPETPQPLCSSLTIKIIKDDKYIYSGKIADLSLDLANSDAGIDDYIFIVSLNDLDPSLRQQNCQFDFIFKTYRPNQPSSGGFVAEKKVNNFITSGNW